MLDIIQYKVIKDKKKLRFFDPIRNSDIYYDDYYLYKIPFHINDNFEKTLNYINNCNLKDLIKINSLIMENNKIVGYTVYNYKEYKNLKKYKNRSLKLKLNDCEKIINICNDLNDNNMFYYDIRRSNLLLNNKTNNLKLCDLDSIKISDDILLKDIQIKRGMKLCLSYLYNIPFYDMNLLLENRINILNNNIYNCIDNVDIEMFYNNINKLINNNDMNKDKKILKKKIKEYKEKKY